MTLRDLEREILIEARKVTDNAKLKMKCYVCGKIILEKYVEFRVPGCEVCFYTCAGECARKFQRGEQNEKINTK